MQYQFRRARIVAGVALAAAGALTLSGVAQASDDSARLGQTAASLGARAQFPPFPPCFPFPPFVTCPPALLLTGVPNANTKAPGVTSPNLLSPELAEVVSAQGSTKLENGGALLRLQRRRSAAACPR
jgi:hypothetical protein